MSFRIRLSSLWWILATLCAVGFAVYVNQARLARVAATAQLTEPAPLATSIRSSTGYVGGLRRYVVPERSNDSYQWILQTQEMLSRGNWRLRHVTYDNAPQGREVGTSSLYRWWLAALAEVRGLFSSDPLGVSVEKAGEWSDVVLFILLVVSTTAFVALVWGDYAATCSALAFSAIYPLNVGFLTAAPDVFNLSLLWAVWSVLPLAAAASFPERARRCSILAGAAAGLGLWTNLAVELPVLSGMAVAGALLAFRRAGSVHWRAWGMAAGVTSLVGYLVEFFPSHMGWQMQLNHPLIALACAGLGDLLARVAARSAVPGASRPSLKALLPAMISAATIVGWVAMFWWKRGPGVLVTVAGTERFGPLANATAAANAWEWMVKQGPQQVLLVLAPSLLALLALGVFFRPDQKSVRPSVLLGLSAFAACGVVAFMELRWWVLADAVVVVVGAMIASTVAAGGFGRVARWTFPAVLLLCVGGGWLQAFPSRSRIQDSVTAGELEVMMERDFSHWLARHTSGKAVVLAPPDLTASLIFHGGLQGIGSPYWENMDGFAAAVRICGATSADEAQGLAKRRGVTHIVMPSWDTFLDQYAQLGSPQADSTLVAMLHNWVPPRWLRPVPYSIPRVSGFESHAIFVFEVVEVQDNVLALSRLADYFLEMEQPALASSVARALEQNAPTDINALISRAQVASAAGDGRGLESLTRELATAISGGADAELPVDRRAGLAYIFARAEKMKLADEQLDRLLGQLDEQQLRSLSDLTLYRLVVLSRVLRKEIPDASLRELAVELLPSEMKAQLAR
jgi:hypothetical protein